MTSHGFLFLVTWSTCYGQKDWSSYYPMPYTLYFWPYNPYTLYLNPCNSYTLYINPCSPYTLYPYTLNLTTPTLYTLILETLTHYTLTLAYSTPCILRKRLHGVTWSIHVTSKKGIFSCIAIVRTFLFMWRTFAACQQVW